MLIKISSNMHITIGGGNNSQNLKTLVNRTTKRIFFPSYLQKKNRKSFMYKISEMRITFTNVWSSESDFWRKKSSEFSLLSESTTPGLSPFPFSMSFKTKTMATLPVEMRDNPFSCNLKFAPSFSSFAQVMNSFDIIKELFICLVLVALINSVAEHLIQADKKTRLNTSGTGTT